MSTQNLSSFCPALHEGQKARFKAGGFGSAGAVDMNGAYAALLTADAADVRRIERLEIFDELEEWHLIQAHYCIAWGVGPARICSTCPSTDQPMFNLLLEFNVILYRFGFFLPVPLRA